MKLAEILRRDGCQPAKLPDEFHLEGNTVSIRRQGESLILAPVKSSEWPPGFFDRIRIDDPAFGRPPQGELPRRANIGLTVAMPNLLDTNTCIAVMRHHEAVVRRLAATVPADCAISSITSYAWRACCWTLNASKPDGLACCQLLLYHSTDVCGLVGA